MNKKVTIDGKIIGEKHSPYIIAEIGLNHNNDIDLTKNSILAAKKSGASAVKFQTYITEKLLNVDSPAFQLFKNLELSKEQFKIISDYCKDIEITFFSTPFCFESVDLLQELDVPCFKIASMDLNYYDLIHYIAKTGKPIILSTGMGTISEIDKAVSVIRKTGNEDIIILHCISKYPPLYSEMNMQMITKLISMYPDYPIGFSDHSKDSTMTLVARVLGASVFEKHFTLNKNLPGPDHQISCEPDDFIELKEKLQNVDDSLNPSTKDRLDAGIAIHARRSLYASKDLKKGQKLNKDDIAIVRPGGGVAPEYLPLFLERELIKDVKKCEKIDLSCF
ncbi:MAG: hypothetical protein A2086_15490 [Spirochaetes bacterium GWD1_27_9]|nr:MAG: hypothetical protein A2Y34_05045 [Spirochaetes bacterium GWC1_27_15]OHD42786.1 MAG: hypothetical protein A2086_15490 [Spirochaetes bacterium GWD1_27_9]